MSDTPLPDLVARIRVDTSDFDAAARRGRSFGMGLGKIVGGGIAAVGGFRLFSSFLADAQESAKIGRITNQIIKSTGGAAKVSASDIDKLAGSLSNKAAIDDELIQSGANLLLTFKNVRNEAGKGNDVFNQATAAALDLSAVG